MRLQPWVSTPATDSCVRAHLYWYTSSLNPQSVYKEPVQVLKWAAYCQRFAQVGLAGMMHRMGKRSKKRQIMFPLPAFESPRLLGTRGTHGQRAEDGWSLCAVSERGRRVAPATTRGHHIVHDDDHIRKARGPRRWRCCRGKART